MQKIILGNNNFTYFTSGKFPKLLIHTGTHGDEYEVIDIVKKYLEVHESDLPSFIYVPQVSPSAVKAKTRFNARENDLNRVFYTDSNDPEVLFNIDVIKKGPFDLFVSFHEDLEYDHYYIYDTSFNSSPTQIVIQHNQQLKLQQIALLNGIDDLTDPSLGYEFVDGYRKFTAINGAPDNGSITIWGLNHGHIKHVLLPEIPRKVKLDVKKMLVESFFKQVVVKYFIQSSASQMRIPNLINDR